MFSRDGVLRSAVVFIYFLGFFCASAGVLFVVHTPPSTCLVATGIGMLSERDPAEAKGTKPNMQKGLANVVMAEERRQGRRFCSLVLHFLERFLMVCYWSVWLLQSINARTKVSSYS